MLKRQGLGCRVGVRFGRKRRSNGHHTGERGLGDRKGKVLVKHSAECSFLEAGRGRGKRVVTPCGRTV